MSLHVTLPSNGVDFPENTTSTYTVKLPGPLTFEGGDWEVGLVDMHYPGAWDNVTNGTITVRHAANGTKTLEVRQGCYTSFDELIADIHRCFAAAKMGEALTVYYDKVRNKTFLNVRQPRTAINFSNIVCQILGLRVGHFYKTGKHGGLYVPDINRGMSSLYVYANVAEPRPVGDMLAPLLRVIPMDSATRTGVKYVEFKNVQYLPVPNTNTDLINVLIRADTGEEIQFRLGKVVLTVVFRRVSAKSDRRW